MRVQIVVPCYNEASRLDVAAFRGFLGRTSGIGLILVNDGSRDGTLTVLNGLAEQFPERVVVIDQAENKGKAEAVRTGMLRAIGLGADYAGYFDADLATPLEASAEFVEVLDRHPELQFIIGARVALLGRTISRKASRHYFGRLFATAASLVLALPVYDTQCGAKLLRINEPTRSLFDKPFGSRWIFDVELIARYLTAAHGNSSGLFELPLRRWTDIGESKVKWHDFMRAGAEMAAIYRAYGIKRDFNTLLRLTTAPFLRYAGAGGVGTACHYLVLGLLASAFAVRPTYATVVGALVGASVNYLLNYHFTFASKTAHRVAMPRFMMVAAMSAALNGLGMWFATTRLGLHYFVAQLGCTAGVLVLGYLLNAAWTFRSRETASGREKGRQPEHSVESPRVPSET
jgi:glycosyltransferase involved in cell wall biosynthesis